MSTAVECLIQFWVDVQTVEPNLSICAGRQQKLFSFFQLNTFVKFFFNDIAIFKTKHR